MADVMVARATSNKKADDKSICFKALPGQICLKLLQLIKTTSMCILCNYEANLSRQSFKINRFKSAFLFDAGGHLPSSWQAPSLIF